MAVSFKIRPMRKSDSHKVARLHRQTILRVNRRDYTQKEVEAWARPIKGRIAWRFVRSGEEKKIVAVDPATRKILGFGGWSEQKGEIMGLFVSHRHQGEGVGKALLETMIEKLRRLRFKEIIVDATVTGVPFYQKFGFVIIEEGKNILKKIL
jgi:putative acetyltransferase